MADEASVWGVGQVPIPGPAGEPGPAGPPNVLSIGSVTQGPAAASITGISPAQILNLTLPEGPPGPQGLPGPAGGAGNLSIGTVTSGTPAAASITGASPNFVLNLTLPKGETGATGAPGQVYSTLLSRTTDQTVGAWPVMVSWQQAAQDLPGTWAVAAPTKLVVPTGITKVKFTIQASLTSEKAAGSVIGELYKNGSPMSPQVLLTNGRDGTTGTQLNVVSGQSYTAAVVAGDYFELRLDKDTLTATSITAAYTWLDAQFY